MQEEKIMIGIDKRKKSYTEKPKDCGLIQNATVNKSFSVPTFRWLLTSGITIRPSVFSGTKFVAQQLFVVDIDNKGKDSFLSVRDVLRTCEKNRICPFLITSSFSGNKYNQKAHYYFLTQFPITDFDLRNDIQNQLNEMLCGDSAMLRPKQLCFTGRYSYGYAPFSRILIKRGKINGNI